MAAERPAPAPEAPYPVARPKAPTPETFSGNRNKLRGWLASLTVYYRTVGWNEGHDEDKIAYTCSLLRGDAGIWLIPYAEELVQPGWNTWEEFKTELKQQFGAVDPQGEARIKLRETEQGTTSMTEYWNEFRLIATEANLDEFTLGEWLITGMKRSLQEEWASDSAAFTTTTNLAE